MQGRLNYIELRVVTQRTYPARESWQIYSTTFWLRLILKNRRHSKLRSIPPTLRARVLARARRPYLFASRVHSTNTFPCSLSAFFSRFPCSLFRRFIFSSFLLLLFSSIDIRPLPLRSVTRRGVPDFRQNMRPPKKRRSIISRLTLIVMHS